MATKSTSEKMDRDKSTETDHVPVGETRPGFNFNKMHSVEGIKQSILNHLKFSLARDTHTARRRDWWLSTTLALRDRMLDRYMKTQKVHNETNTRRVYYLSLNTSWGAC